MRLPVSAALCALFLAGPALAADEPAPDMARAAALRTEAGTIRDAAEARFSDEEIDCYKRFLVNRCLDQAKERRVLEIRRARQMDLEAGRIELADKNRRYTERKTEEAATAPQKAVERAETEARNRAETEERLRHLSEKDAERIRNEQEAKSRGMREAEERNRHEAAEAKRRADEAEAAARRAEQARGDKADYEERAAKNAEKKAEKAKKAAEQQPK
ncbi:hypothetical protein GCM10007933_29670 [Zoogloea oryzae]|uniref:TolA protein n=1 Tax=Zoogloea oryzae TaxID=310767 RepID=A0ABQ6FD01_9RHOO|nr:hypothetical protein [Zoogloea oryzae]GLT23500.1 hypothetical protein GCM10007933_29670 [Zoogloea oryzae]